MEVCLQIPLSTFSKCTVFGTVSIYLVFIFIQLLQQLLVEHLYTVLAVVKVTSGSTLSVVGASY